MCVSRSLRFTSFTRLFLIDYNWWPHLIILSKDITRRSSVCDVRVYMREMAVDLPILKGFWLKNKRKTHNLPEKSNIYVKEFEKKWIFMWSMSCDIHPKTWENKEKLNLYNELPCHWILYKYNSFCKLIDVAYNKLYLDYKTLDLWSGINTTTALQAL